MLAKDTGSFSKHEGGYISIMPNHVHGIIQIKENVRRGEVSSPIKKGDEVRLGDVGAPPMDLIVLFN